MLKHEQKAVCVVLTSHQLQARLPLRCRGSKTSRQLLGFANHLRHANCCPTIWFGKCRGEARFPYRSISSLPFFAWRIRFTADAMKANVTHATPVFCIVSAVLAGIRPYISSLPGTVFWIHVGLKGSHRHGFFNTMV